MAKIGLKYPVYALANEVGAAISYSYGAVLAKAISANINITTNDVKLYADDSVCESDHSFSSGTISITIDDLSDAAKRAILGYTEGATVDPTAGTKEMKASGNDSPAFVGFGFYGKKVVSGAKHWRAIWLKKVQFKEPSDEMATKGETTEFGTTTLEGTILVSADGFWKEEATFDTEAEAVAFLNGKSGISNLTSNNLSALVFENGTLTPAFAGAKYNYSCALTGDTAITATFAAGAAKVYVDGAYTETLASTVKGATIPVATGVSKVIQVIVQESGKSAVTYTVMVQRA